MTKLEIIEELTNVENQLNSEQIEEAKSDLNLLIHNLETEEVDEWEEGEIHLPKIKYEEIEINGC
jgi:hypothetical protein